MDRILFDERLLELTSLFEISRSLTSSLSIHAILENILRIPMGHMLISRGMILLKKGEENEFILEEIKGIPHSLLGKSLTVDSLPAHATLLTETGIGEDWTEFFKKFD